MSADDGRVFWRQPRWLSRALEDGEINRCEFMLLVYLGGAGLDRFGVSTTLGELSSLLGFTRKWVSDALHRLRAKGLIEFDLGERQRRPFRITEGPALREATDFRTEFRREFRSQTRMAPGIEGGAEAQDFRTEFRSDEGDFRSGDQPQSQDQSAVAPQPTQGTSAVSETETDTNPSGNDSVGTTPELDDAHAREDDLGSTDRLIALLRDPPPPDDEERTLDQELLNPEQYAENIEPFTRCHLCKQGEAQYPAIFYGQRMAVCQGCVETNPPIARAVRDAAEESSS